MTDGERLLLSRIETLEAAIAELRDQIALARRGGFRSMRDTKRCPACAGEALLHFRRVREQTYGELAELALDHRQKWTGTNVPRAPLEAFACRGCGLVEWHAVDFDGIEADGDRIVAIDPEGTPPSDGPFR